MLVTKVVRMLASDDRFAGPRVDGQMAVDAWVMSMRRRSACKQYEMAMRGERSATC